jgi:hypothetical protein
MRRLAALLALVFTLVAGGCAGADGQRAQELLAQSDQALAHVETFRFAGRMTMSASVGDFGFTMTGGGDAQPGGSFFVKMQAPELPNFPGTMVVVRGDEAWMKLGGTWQKLPLPAADLGSMSGIEQFDLTPYVKDVDVDEDAVVGGEPAAKITGVLNTAGLFEGVLGQLGSFAGPLPEDFSDMLGDTRAVIYVSDATHLPLRILVDMTMEIEGESVTMHLDYAITDVNEPVKVPGPGA